MPSLNFSSNEYGYSSEAVTHVLSRRNSQADVSLVNLYLWDSDSQIKMLVKRILEYASSHNVQQLNITYTNLSYLTIHEHPLSIFNFHSLKHLTLASRYGHYIAPPTWELPALTTLNLQSVHLYNTSIGKSVGPFSNCTNLKNLTLNNCWSVGLNICHPELSSLTIIDGDQGHDPTCFGGYEGVNVDKAWRWIKLISTPNLSSLHYKDSVYPLNLRSDIPHLEEVDICISSPYKNKENVHKIVSMLQRVRSVKFLTLNLEIIEVLSSYVKLISRQPSPFANLKSLKIYPANVSNEEQTQPNATMSTEVKNYFLDRSPGATLTMVTHEEIRVARNVAKTKELMSELQEVLDKMKENHEINTTDMAQPDTKMKWKLGDRMTHIESYWEDLKGQLEEGYINAGRTISLLRQIEEVLTKLPTSSWDKLQARFSGMCVEADTIMDNMMDHLKIQCDKRPRFKGLVS